MSPHLENSHRRMIRIIAVGKMKNRELASLCAEYEKRLGRYDKAQVLELKDAGAAQEGTRILEALDACRGRVYVLSEEGSAFTSKAFSAALEADMQNGPSVFVIGGPYGLDDRVKRRADVLMSISPMTFTHEWARAILMEQLYRAKSISAGSGYHH